MSDDGAPRVVLLAGRLGPEYRAAALDLVDRLGRLGFRACLVDPTGPAADPWSDGVRFGCPGLVDPWRRAWAVRRLALAERPGRPDLIHALGLDVAEAALALAERWAVPYLLTVDEFLPPGGRLRLARPWCRGLLATSPALADDLVASLLVPRRAIAVARPGIVLADDRAGELSESIADPGRVPVVGAAGRLVAGAGFGTFLAAARRIVAAGRDVEFVVVGRGPAEPDLRRLADRLGVASRVTFADEADRPTVWRVLDLYCQPSPTPDSGRPLRQALAHGLPCVVSDVAGLRDWHDAGRLVAPGDPDALARALLALLDDPSEAAALGQRARSTLARLADPAPAAADLADRYRAALAAPEAIIPPPRSSRRTSAAASRRS